MGRFLNILAAITLSLRIRPLYVNLLGSGYPDCLKSFTPEEHFGALPAIQFGGLPAISVREAL